MRRFSPQRARQSSPRRLARFHQTRPRVEELEPRTLLSASAGPKLVFEGQLTPSDPLLSQQYALTKIQAPQAWATTTGSHSVVVADIDTGIDYTHPDLYQNVWINQQEIPAARRANLIDIDGDGLISFRDLNNPINQGVGKITDLNHNGVIDAGDLLAPYNPDGTGGWADGTDGDGSPNAVKNGYVDDIVGWDFYHNDNNPFDGYGHGTHTAGTIGATGNNGTGVSGVNWDVSLMALKVT